MAETRPTFLLLLAVATTIAAHSTARAQDAPATGAPPGYGESPYRLGAGDVLSIRLYGQPETLRPQVTVAPDGSLTYLSAVGLPVRGKTISEAKAALEKALTDFYKRPQVIITPIQLLSKSFTIMGMVKRTGIFPLEQPTTVIEALARAGGTVSGLFDRRYVDLADLERSFLLRNGQRVPVNFRKLMLEGDMSQNLSLEPDDYIYISSALANNYYVLGAVRKPGREGFTEGATVMAAIAKRLGFQDTAYRERVLVVRGSLDDPEVFVVNADAIMKGSKTDFPLQPKDLVYVSNRPWYKAEEVVDSAVDSFLQAATAVWVGGSVPAVIQNSIVPVTGTGTGSGQ